MTKYQPLTIDMTKDRYQVRYRLGLNSVFIPDSSPFLNKTLNAYSMKTTITI